MDDQPFRIGSCSVLRSAPGNNDISIAQSSFAKRWKQFYLLFILDRIWICEGFGFIPQNLIDFIPTYSVVAW